MQPVPSPAPAAEPARFTLPAFLLRTARVWVRHLAAFTLVGLILDLPIVAVELRGKLGQDDVAGVLLYSFLLWTLRMLGTAALSVGVLRSLAGERPTVASMLATPARSLWPIFAVAGAWSALALLGFSLVLPGIFVLAAGYVAIPAVVAEPDMGTEAALRRSLLLTKGHRLVLLAGFVGLFGLEQLGSLGAARLMTGPLAGSPPAGIAVEVAADALLCGLTSCSFAVAYHGLRVVKGLGAPRVRPPASA